MSEPTGVFKRFLYITAEPEADAVTEYLQALQSLCWRQTALVRWSVAGLGTVGESAVRGADLIVIDWHGDPTGCERVFQSIRQWESQPAAEGAPSLRPVLILRAASEVTPVFLSDHPGAAVLDPGPAVDQQGLNKAFRALGFELPIRRILDSAVGVDEPAIRKIIQDVGLSQFDLVLQKYFPLESKPKLFPVEGGWSGDPLVRVHARVDGGIQKEFFLKLFSRKEKFTNEIQNHEQAFEWLKTKDAAIPLRRIPELGETAVEQLAAFPSAGPSPAPVFPVCYVSANADTKHMTFKDLFFEPKRQSDIGKAFKRILAVLDAGKGDQSLPPQPPFVGADEEGPLVLSYKWRAAILLSIGELDRYGPAAFGGEWRSCRVLLELLAYKGPSGKLVEPRTVAVGPIHGDPNPRNCLVNPDAPEHLLMIDCGDFAPQGRLVSDLALIERDIKLVLMGNEKRQGGFYELDPGHLPAWCKAEWASIDRGLDYSSKDVASFETTCPSAFAAHSLVVAIRRQARAIRGADDPEGRHYFAALLYWMMRALDERAIPPTKKLLALYSMAQILRVFF